jgi:RNA polymerase sigma-70 factor (ECF subfamily)
MNAVRALVTPAGESDQARLAALFDAHADRLYRLARRLTSSREDASDLVQDTFLRAARSIRSLPTGSHAEAWLVRVLVNLQRDAWRKGAVRRRAPAANEANQTNIEAAVDAKRLVWRALSALQPRRRAVIVMHELDGVSVPDVARVLGITAVTVRWHLSRGRRELRQLLKGQPS